MSNNFDPTKHKFGMAYYADNGLLIYPVKMGEVTCRAVIEPYLEWPQYYDFFNQSITRSPEHDLLPRADVMELVKALDEIASGTLRPAHFVAQQSLANFNQKYDQLTQSPENVSCADLTNAADSSQNVEYEKIHG